MPITVLAMTTVNPTEQEALASYVSGTAPLLEKAGARVVSQKEVIETLSGEQSPQFVTTIEYPDRNAIADVFESEAYRLLIPSRDRAFTRYDICILS